ncbi:MAG: hypothetical protein HC780_22105 [Leptolyngbyaceae cyanobacterium CSU_1_3]|nr:hypothetical protein [Leptolyngbyaceae cyanobacterium CSU_1_3]
MKRDRQKSCDLCTKSALVLYRVRRDESSEWIFVCRSCWDHVSRGNPFYVYGGTWKAKKR